MRINNIRNVVKQIIFGTNDDLSLQREMYLLINLITIIIASIGFIANIIQGMNLWSSFVIAVSIIVVTYFYISARNNDKKELLLLPLFVSSLVLLAFGWLTNGGYDGSITSLIFIFFIAIYFLVKQKHRVLVFVSYLILFSALVLFQHFDPEIVIPYNNPEQRLIDILIGGLLYLILLYSFISIITKSYESENQKVISINEILKKQNKDIAENILIVEKSEEKFSKTFNICPVAISIATIENGSYLEVNDAFLKISGFTREEIIGHTFDELNFYLDHTERKRLIDELLKNSSLKNFEFQFRMKNGEIRDSLVTSDIIEIDGTRCSLNFLTDITEQKIAVEKIKKSEESLNEAQKIAKMGSWELDLINNKTTWSENYFKLYGMNPNEIEPNHDLFRKKVHPDDLHLIDEGFEQIQKNKSALNIEMRIIQEDNTIKWIQNNIVPVFQNDKLITLKGINLDITERKQAEKELLESETKFRVMFENSRDAISVSKNGIRAFANKALMIMFGYENYDSIIGKSILDSIAESHHQQIIQKVHDVANGVPTSSFYESKGLKRDGTVFDIEISGTNFSLNGEEYSVGMIRDISERKQAEDALKESQKNYKTLFEANSDGITIFALRENEPPSTILDLNPNAYIMVGYTKEEMLSMNPNDIEKDITWDKIEKRSEDIKTKGFSEFETILKHKKGHEIFVEIKVMIIDYNNKPALMNIARDISERKHAEKMLQDIIDKNPIAIQVLDMEGFTIQTNKAHSQLFGAITPSDYSIFQDTQLLQQGMGDLFERIRSGEVVSFPDSYFNVHKVDPSFPDSSVWVKAIGFALNDVDRKPNKIILMQENITERKNAEKILYDIIDKNPMSIQIVDKDGFTLQGNPSYTQLFGLVPPPDFSIFADLQSKSPDLDKIIQTAKSGEVVHFPDMFYNPHDVSPEFPDNPVWIRALLFPLLDSSGKPEKYVFMHENITERKLADEALHASEKRFRNLLQDVNLISVQGYAPDGVTTYWNKASEQLYGYSAEEAIGRNLLDLIIPPIMREDVKQAILYMDNTGQPIPSGELTLMRKDGSYLDVYSTHTIIKIPGKPQELFCIDIDLTERKNAEKEIILAKEKAEESEKLKTAFLQNISHEIRTPLNGILGFSKLLQGDDLSKEDIKEFTGIIQKSGNRLMETVGNVLDISKIETGQIDVKLESFSLNSLLSNLNTFFSNTASTNGVILDSYFALKNKDSIIECDEFKLNQILTNLINNALKFTTEGKIEFGYNIKDNEIVFYVKDTGVGIPEDLKHRIFTRFAQINLSITRGYEGVGLGLSICKGLVELLGGRIWFESEVNKGTTFFFTIPYSPVATISQEEINQEEIQTKNAQVKILIVEDDWTSFQYLSKLLSNSNYTLIHADNGLEAIEFINKEIDIKLVLMDIRMPVMNGIEATKLIKQIRPDLPIIAQTAYAFSSEREEILSIGCNDYISKPISKEDLLKLIEKYSK